MYVPYVLMPIILIFCKPHIHMYPPAIYTNIFEWHVNNQKKKLSPLYITTLWHYVGTPFQPLYSFTTHICRLTYRKNWTRVTLHVHTYICMYIYKFKYPRMHVNCIRKHLFARACSNSTHTHARMLGEC